MMLHAFLLFFMTTTVIFIIIVIKLQDEYSKNPYKAFYKQSEANYVYMRRLYTELGTSHSALMSKYERMKADMEGNP